jgi:uncharacterized protein CbrC (UPF0167 family)
MDLPAFRYNPDPIASGSVKASDAICVCCKHAKGYVYAGPVYAEADYEETICPWCIADGSAHELLDATFVDTEALSDSVPADVIVEITTRTPGYASWQAEQWPTCCADGTAFLKPVGIEEIRRDHYQWEGFLMEHIVHKMGISGGSARRLLESLNKDHGPTAYAFQCLHCQSFHFHIDSH